MSRPTLFGGEAPVERLHERGGGEVADPDTRLDRGMAETDERVALAGARGTDEDEVLGGPDPLQAGEVVERRPRDRRLADVEHLRASW
jgi:hypothetical protein